MYFDTVNAYWNAYEKTGVDMTVHPDDDMWGKSKTPEDYRAVGRAAVSLIATVIALSRARSIERVLDFGCGHGRVARHLRAFFPRAELHFSDIDAAGAQFCASQFGGHAHPSTEDFAQLDLPGNMDVIWLGSVFTHLSPARMNALFTPLFRSLSVGGSLIITFRGRNMYRTMLADHSSQVLKWQPLIEAYEKTGAGYQPYGVETPEWGLSLNTVQSIMELSKNESAARFLCFSEAAWAVSHDVAAWTRV